MKSLKRVGRDSPLQERTAAASLKAKETSQGTHLYLSRILGTEPCASRKWRENSSQDTCAVPHILHVKMPLDATDRGSRLGG